MGEREGRRGIKRSGSNLTRRGPELALMRKSHTYYIIQAESGAPLKLENDWSY